MQASHSLRLEMSDFGHHFAELLAKRELTYATFARLAGVSAGSPANIASGRHPPPKNQAKLEKWADLLRLNVEQRERFLELAYLEHTPEPIRAEYLRMKMVLSKRR